MAHPLVDKPAPSFSIQDSNGELFKFPPETDGKRIEKPIALFFYPRSGTIGCTLEACQFRDALVEKEIYKRSDVLVVGVSSDPVEKQKAFVEQNKLSYPVLSDTDHTAHKAYEVGRGLMGLSEGRVTFIIDRNGIIKGVFSSVLNFSAHTNFVTKELDKLLDSKGRDSDDEYATPPVNTSEDAERVELARAAQAMSG